MSLKNKKSILNFSKNPLCLNNTKALVKELKFGNGEW